MIGDNVNSQLEPFDENIEVAPYKKYWDTANIESWERTLSGNREGKYSVEAGTLLANPGEASMEEIAAVFNARYAGDPEEDVRVDSAGIYEWSTYNPQSKWDWYTIGGRWSGYFKTREWTSDFEAWNTIHTEALARGLDHEQAGQEADRYMQLRKQRPAALGESGVFDNEPEHDADVVFKGDVDAEAMRAATGERTAEWWDRMHELLEHLPEAKPWSEYVARVKEAEQQALLDKTEPSYTIEQAREEYGAQTRVQALHEHDQRIRQKAHALSQAGNKDKAEEFYAKVLGGWMDDGIEGYQRGREECVQRARDARIPPYAYVKDGEWEAPGKMGWFGMSDEDDLTRVAWNREFNIMFDALPADTPLTLVDAHI